MSRFSQREGFKEVRNTLQIDSMDADLRNRLWNVLDLYYWNESEHYYTEDVLGSPRVLFRRLCHNLFKIPVSTLDLTWGRDLEYLKKHFFRCPWFEVYDFIEFVANEYENKETNEYFKKTCNKVLEEEMSGYRFVGNQLVKITSEIEIAEIEESLKTPFASVNKHIETALCHLTNKKSPDFRNSIKESISGVEAICQIIANDEDATLTKALTVIEKRIPLNNNLKEAFKKLYHYTSSAEGIRHAIGMTEEPNLSFEDAKFMIVSCSAFINYLVSKASKANIEMEHK